MLNQPNVKPKPTKNEEKRRNIIDCAAELFAEQGYKATTVDAIADRLKVNKATIYWYYPSKSEILYEIIIEMVDRSDQICRNSIGCVTAIEAIDQILLGLVEFSKEQLNIFRVYFQELVYLEQNLPPNQYAIIRKSERKTIRTIYELLERGVRAGEIAPCDVKYVGRLAIGLALAPYRWRESDVDVDRVMQSIRLICFTGLRLQKD